MFALIAAGSIVAGCGTQAKVTTGAQSQPSVISTVVPFTTPPATSESKPLDDDPVAAVRRDKSLEGARPDGKEVRRRTRILEARLLKDCLAARGISFDGVLQPTVDEGSGDHSFWLPIRGTAEAQKNGFQQREDLSAGVIRPTDPKLLAALEGDDKRDKGCRSSVGDEVAKVGVDATRQLYSEIVTLFQNRQTESIESDAGIPAVTAAWKACMIAEGVGDTTDRRDLLRKYLSAPTLTEQERVAAVADAQCASSSGLNDLLLRASEQTAVQVVQELSPKIKALRDADRALLLKLPPA